MARKRKHSEESPKETIEDKVLKKYRKSKKKDNQTEESEEVVNETTFADKEDNFEDNFESDVKITSEEDISAQKILKRVKKIKDENTKNAIKLRKKSRKLAKKQLEEEIQQKTDITNSGNKSQSAINYLNDWKYRKNDWKFKKSLQIYLLKNWKNSNKISDKDFDIFVEYISAINKESFAKKRIDLEAKQLIDKQTDDTNEDEDQKKVVERARRLLQCSS